jgi:hypothetical protein
MSELHVRLDWGSKQPLAGTWQLRCRPGGDQMHMPVAQRGYEHCMSMPENLVEVPMTACIPNRKSATTRGVGLDKQGFTPRHPTGWNLSAAAVLCGGQLASYDNTRTEGAM